MAKNNPEVEEGVSSETSIDVEEPPMYKVLLLNDDYTSMEFVVEVLMFVFRKTVEAATQIMLNVHQKGVGVCGFYPLEIAETKMDAVDALAREKGFPLKCTLERE